MGRDVDGRQLLGQGRGALDGLFGRERRGADGPVRRPRALVVVFFGILANARPPPRRPAQDVVAVGAVDESGPIPRLGAPVEEFRRGPQRFQEVCTVSARRGAGRGYAPFSRGMEAE